MKRIERIETAMARLAPDACLDGIAQRAALYEELAGLYGEVRRVLKLKPANAAKQLVKATKLASGLCAILANADGALVVAYGKAADETTLAFNVWVDAPNIAHWRARPRRDPWPYSKRPRSNPFARQIVCQAANDYWDLTGRTPSRSYKSDFPGFVEEIFRACGVNERPDTIIKELLAET